MGRFDLISFQGRELLLSDEGCEVEGSKLIDATLGCYALDGRGDYRFFLSSFMNYEAKAGEHRWAFLFEPRGVVIKRALAWVRTEFKLICTTGGFPDGSFDVLRDGAPVNRYVRAFSVVRKLFLIAQREDFAIRPIGNPMSILAWDTKSDEQKYQHCVLRYGPKMASKTFKYAGGMFIAKARTPYIPSCTDPAGLGDRIFDAMVALLGDHAAADVAGVNRDDGQRFADVNFITFADYAISNFDKVLLGSNKRGEVDELGRRLASKPVAISEEVRERIHRRVDAEHKANPTLPSMAQVRSWLAAGNLDELRKWHVFSKPGMAEPYSYSGYHRLEVKAVIAAKVVVERLGKIRPATSRWQRRALHEREYLRIHRETKDPVEIERRKARLTNERGHRTDQHENYASHALHVLAVEDKFERIEKDETRRLLAKSGNTLPANTHNVSASATAQRHATTRSRYQ